VLFLSRSIISSLCKLSAQSLRYQRFNVVLVNDEIEVVTQKMEERTVDQNLSGYSRSCIELFGRSIRFKPIVF
jgi:hypothetical protein